MAGLTMPPTSDTTLDFHGDGAEADFHPRTLVITILAHPDARRVGEQAHLSARDAELGLHRGFPSFGSGGVDRPLDTPYVSRQPLHLALLGPEVVVTTGGDRPVQVDGVSAFRHAIPLPRVEAGIVLRLSQEVVILARLGRASPPPASRGPGDLLFGPSPALHQVRETILRIGPLASPVLIRGETGTGKELVAEALHRASARSRGPFVAVNLAAIPSATAASQLFGHVRGAFTGAEATRTGLFGDAEGGTLFLDEIGEAAVDLQALLLRAIDRGEVQQVGARARVANVRILAATDASLEQLVHAARFRSALFHRLAATTIALPPLRERREDVAALLVRFVQEALGPRAEALLGPPAGASRPPWLGADVMLAALAYPWPGNVRELRAAAEWMVAHSADAPRARLPPVPAGGGPEAVVSPHAGASPAPVAAPVAPVAPDERARVLAALEAHEFRLEPAARALNLSRNTLRARMKEHGLRRAIDLTDAELALARDAAGSELAAVAAALGVGEHALRLRLGAG